MVNLADGTEGIVTFRSGEQFWCMGVFPDPDDPTLFLVRYEHGWHALFRRDGVQHCTGMIQHQDGTTEEVVNHQRDIVAFEPCPYPDGMPSEVRP